jgi:hypothetical protein
LGATDRAAARSDDRHATQRRRIRWYRIRPDVASPDLAPFVADPSMPAYLQHAIEESRQLYRHEASPKMIYG